MALTDESTNSMVMPVAPLYGNGNGGGMGWGGDWAWIILLLVLCGGWGNGLGGGFGGGFGNMMLGYDFPWLMTGQAGINANTNGGFRDQMLGSQIMGIQNSITSGFGDVQNSLCAGFAGVNANIANGFAQSEIAANARQISDLQQMFNLQSQLASCCCENRLATADTKYTLATEACATRTADANNTTAILNALNGGFQAIKDQLCDDKLEAKNDLIAQLRSELMYARGQASQDVQTAAIQAGQRALANEVEQYVLPTPRPAYIVQNPNCCQQTYGCGCAA